MPDAFAAAKLLEALARLLPEVKLNLEPLREQAKALEAHLQRLREEAKPVVSEPSVRMFG